MVTLAKHVEDGGCNDLQFCGADTSRSPSGNATRLLRMINDVIIHEIRYILGEEVEDGLQQCASAASGKSLHTVPSARGIPWRRISCRFEHLAKRLQQFLGIIDLFQQTGIPLHLLQRGPRHVFHGLNGCFEVSQ